MIKYNGQTAEINKRGHYVVGNTLVSLDGVNLIGGAVHEFTEEEVMEMTVAELESVGDILGIELSGLKADKQQQILAAL